MIQKRAIQEHHANWKLHKVCLGTAPRIVTTKSHSESKLPLPHDQSPPINQIETENEINSLFNIDINSSSSDIDIKSIPPIENNLMKKINFH